MNTTDPLDTAPPPLIDPAQLDNYLSVYASAWVSGYVSMIVSAAHKAGVPAEIRADMAHRFQHQAAHLIRDAIHDPVSRATIVAGIEHLVAGGPAPDHNHSELSVRSTGSCPGHRDDDGGRS